MKALSSHCQLDNRLEILVSNQKRVLAKYERIDIQHTELEKKVLMRRNGTCLKSEIEPRYPLSSRRLLF